MNSEERKSVQRMYVVLSEVYNRSLSEAAISFLADSLMDLDGQKVITAMKSCISNPETKGFPMPGQIRAMVSPQVSNEQLAVEASNKIVEAMSKFGYTQPEKARAFMGEIAWEVVQREGGWQSLCERTTNDELPILKAQWRSLAAVVSIRQKQDHVALPSADRKLLEEK